MKPLYLVPVSAETQVVVGRPSKQLASVPNRIREIRLLRGLTLQALSERVGCSDETIRRYETGEGAVTLAQLERVAQELGVRAADLINDRPDSAA